MASFKSVAYTCFKFGFCGLLACALWGPRVTDKFTKEYVETHPNARLPEKLHLTVYVDDHFSFVEYDAVMKGLKEWDRATNGMITTEAKHGWSKEDDFNDIPDRIATIMGQCSNTIHIARMTPEDPLVKKIETEVGYGINGFAEGDCQKKYVLLVMGTIETSDVVTLTTIHEIGHLLGLEHTPVPFRTTMYPGEEKTAPCVTELDLIQLCDLEQFDCKVLQMKPCILVEASE